MLLIKLRFFCCVCSRKKMADPVDSPAEQKFCSALPKKSKMGQRFPIEAYVGRNPRLVVDRPMPIKEQMSACFLPKRSPIHPKKSDPIGRASDENGNMAYISTSAVTGSFVWKNSGAMNGAVSPKIALS